MLVTNKETGKNITRLVIKYLEGKLTKKEFEQQTNLNNYA